MQAFDCKYKGCKNGGVCQLISSEVGMRVCMCPEGFRGEYCEIPAVTCGRGYCTNDGVCTARGECQCTGNFTGPTCESRVKVCPTLDTAEHPNMLFYCLNGGECAMTAGFDHPVCACPEDFMGEHCESRVVPCYGGSYCVQGNGVCAEDGMRCECFNGFSGETCDVAVIQETNNIPVVFIAIMAVLVAGGTAMGVFLFVMYQRERKGNPLFEALLDESAVDEVKTSSELQKTVEGQTV
eukprot:CAMPEP_0117652840 /NCGR_PEP_ID=MMETSP0804-20121206/2852_1 /TAXON_ID=1074897 /ORGANISM="Tetraselmis astigmatica, Strain CCMP880" /LENGTH=237 /DNA_ID=CAMNT_0005458935 /DNA_START=746 /DNA_END=1459 /DNA_ORIENTATION=-